MIGFHACIIHVLCGESISLNRIFVGKTSGSRELVHTIVRLWSHHVMVNFDNLTLLCGNQSCGMIAIPEFRTRFASTVFHQFLTVKRFRIHGYESTHTVTTVNVKYLCDRTKTMSSINVATEILVVFQSPT